MPDWYRDHPHAGPSSDAEYYEWAQDNGLYVDAAGNVDYGPPEPTPADVSFAIPDDEVAFPDDEAAPGGLDTWEF